VRIEGGVLKGHHGIDLECALGDPIYAPFDGQYFSGGYQVNGEEIGYGRHIQFVSTFGDGETLYWGFSHLEDDRFLTRGFVRAGDIIGYCGQTGYESSSIHTHMEMGRAPVFSSKTRNQLINPESRLTTTFNSAGTPTTPINCRK
jgi:murein DD-endopeptidase MepM/ murein hydrolase activator NlpD